MQPASWSTAEGSGGWWEGVDCWCSVLQQHEGTAQGAALVTPVTLPGDAWRLSGVASRTPGMNKLARRRIGPNCLPDRIWPSILWSVYYIVYYIYVLLYYVLFNDYILNTYFVLFSHHATRCFFFRGWHWWAHLGESTQTAGEYQVHQAFHRKQLGKIGIN